MNDFFSHIDQPTARVNTSDTDDHITGFLSENDFDQAILNNPPIEFEPKEESEPLDPEFTTKFIVDFFDGTQKPLFYYMNQSRKRKKFFPNKEEYSEAVKLSYMSNEELENTFPENHQDKKALVSKLKDFNGRMEKVKKDLDFTDDEKKQLEAPIRKMVKKANLDIPPGLALVMVVSKIMSARFIDLYAD